MDRHNDFTIIIPHIVVVGIFCAVPNVYDGTKNTCCKVKKNIKIIVKNPSQQQLSH